MIVPGLIPMNSGIKVKSPAMDGFHHPRAGPKPCSEYSLVKMGPGAPADYFGVRFSDLKASTCPLIARSVGNLSALDAP